MSADSISHKQCVVYAREFRDVFHACLQRREMVNFIQNAVYLSSRRHNSPPKLTLRNNQYVQNVYMWMQQEYSQIRRAIFTILP